MDATAMAIRRVKDDRRSLEERRRDDDVREAAERGEIGLRSLSDGAREAVLAEVVRRRIEYLRRELSKAKTSSARARIEVRLARLLGEKPSRRR
jgi:predicted ATP-binding protein involved in virulence